MNVGLLVGAHTALVVDSGTSLARGQWIRAAATQVTSAALLLVNTHCHFDHTFGNAAFKAGEIYGHSNCAAALRDSGEEQRASVLAAVDDEDLVRQIAASPLVAPGRIVQNELELDLGGHRVRLWHPGRGHTDGDLCIQSLTTGALFAGDLVEEGNPPSFGDSYPLDWPNTLEGLLQATPSLVVPGHGQTVTAKFVERQRRQIAEQVSASLEGSEPGGPWPATFQVARQRALWQLDQASSGGPGQPG